MKQTIEVEVPDGMELVVVGQPSDPHFKVIRVVEWQYPEWLGGAGVAQDSWDDTRWFVWGSEEAFRAAVRGRNEGDFVNFEELDSDCTQLWNPWFPQWTPPPNADDWRESWHPNPRA